MVKQDRPVGPDGFAEGIITDKTENVIPVEEPEQDMTAVNEKAEQILSQARAQACLLYTSPSPRDYAASRMPSSA